MSLPGPANDACSQSPGDDTPETGDLFFKPIPGGVESSWVATPPAYVTAGRMIVPLF